MDLIERHDTQHSDIQHNDIQHNELQHNNKHFVHDDTHRNGT